ncbi:MAG TPA: ABC transporter substrate-binding protein [Solirubrobacteraceae bacterium]|jgi:ABC-type nitrate/sulfonate/bicarbonate transport system substrate-binding protein
MPALPFRSSVRRRAAAGVLALALAAAGYGAATEASSAAGSAPATATVKIALDWTANVNYLGIYAALAKGYFAAQHIKAVILPYANTAAEPLIQAGQTDLGISYPPDVIINNASGTLHYKALAALVTDNTTALAVLASSKYTRPAQLSGKIYGGFGIASDKPLVTSILHADGVKDPVFKQVVLGSDVITALKAHRVEYTAVFDGIDDVTASLEGVKLRTFLYNRYLGAAGNYPNAVFVASDADIAARGPVLARALKALAQGYEFAAHHPAAAERILINDNQTALAAAKQITYATGNATAPHFLDKAGSWGPETDADYVGLERILAKGHLIKSSPSAGALYTNALLPPG